LDDYYYDLIEEFCGDISLWDVSNVTDMSWMFCFSGFDGDISRWDVSSVKTMYGMFAYSNFNTDISQWDVRNVEDMTGMFYESQFNQVISSWQADNVKSWTAFSVDSKFTGEYPSALRDQIEEMNSRHGLGGGDALQTFNESFDIDDFDISIAPDKSMKQSVQKHSKNYMDVTAFVKKGYDPDDPQSLKTMCKEDSNELTRFIDEYESFDDETKEIFNRGKLRDMFNTITYFVPCDKMISHILDDKLDIEDQLFAIKCLSQIHDRSHPLYAYYTPGQTSVNEYYRRLAEMSFSTGLHYKHKTIDNGEMQLHYIIWYLCRDGRSYSLKDVNLNWIDTSRMTDFSDLFNESKFRGDISLWDTSNVTNMFRIFCEAKYFNGDISQWNVSNVEDMS